MRKMLTIVSILAIFAMVLVGCAVPAAPAAPAEEAPAAEEAAPAAEEAAPAGEIDTAELDYTTVVKIAGIGWFNRMEDGVQEWGEETGVNANLVGPDQADAALQIPIIEDLIAQGVDALCVVPMDPAQLDPVLQKAMDAGITVITHEASNQESMHWDIEAFDNVAFGASMMDKLAALMGEEGEYAIMVGSLGSKTHMEWMWEGAHAHQLATYPNMTFIAEQPFEAADDQNRAYETAKEILAANPNIKGFISAASTDILGIGQAIEEAGLQDTVAVVGTGLPSQAADLLQSGAVDAVGGWDPAMAGKACNEIALRMARGETIGEGTDLGIPGYESLTLVGDNVLYGNAAVFATLETLDQYPY
jgi:simple sugar transport system substrate-binding protein